MGDYTDPKKNCSERWKDFFLFSKGHPQEVGKNQAGKGGVQPPPPH